MTMPAEKNRGDDIAARAPHAGKLPAQAEEINSGNIEIESLTFTRKLAKAGYGRECVRECAHPERPMAKEA